MNVQVAGLDLNDPGADNAAEAAPHAHPWSTLSREISMTKSIVFVEDDSVIRENYAEVLSEEGYSVRTYGDRHSALLGLHAGLPDLVILDISLGEERDAGYELCREIRKISNQVPIIFLTSHDRDVDRISGMRLGGDDYLIKDVSLDYLVVRIESILRRFETLRSEGNKSAAENTHILRRGELTIDTEKNVVTWKGQLVEMSLTQFSILQELAIRPGQTKSCSKLMSAAKIVVEPNTIAAHIKGLRKKFRMVDPDFDLLRTEYGNGYRWADYCMN